MEIEEMYKLLEKEKKRLQLERISKAGHKILNEIKNNIEIKLDYLGEEDDFEDDDIIDIINEDNVRQAVKEYISEVVI